MSNEPVMFPLAKIYGLIERELSGGENSDDPTTADEYAEGFMEDNARSIIAEYTFTNKKGLQDVFIVSAFISDVTCIVKFNGYLIAKREF